METKPIVPKNSVIKVLNLCKEAVLNNDWNCKTVKAINACAKYVKRNSFISSIHSTKYVLLANINGINKSLNTINN